MSIHHSKLNIRITILGEKNSGKTSLVRSYLNLTSTDDHSKEAAYTYDTLIEGTNATLQILDSDGKNSAVTAWAHGVIVVYSVHSKDGLKEAEKNILRIKKLTMKNATIMIVANKVDIADRLISLEDGQKLATKHNCNYKELSALRDSSTINSVFYELSHEIIEKRGLASRKHHTPTMVRRIFQAISQSLDKKSYVYGQNYDKKRSNTSYI